MTNPALRRFILKWGWLTVAIALGAAAAAIGFGALGVLRPDDPLSSRIVNTLRLFTFDAPTPTAADPNPRGLQIAQFLAPVSLTIFGLRITAPIYGKRLRLWWIRRRNHSIVCGLSDAGMHIANGLAQADDDWIVVIEPNAIPARSASLNRRRVVLLDGDATDLEVLHTAGIETAQQVFVTVSNDADAQRIRDAILDSDRKPKRRPTDRYLHIRVRDLLVRRHLQIQAATEPRTGWEIGCFGVAEHAYDQLYTKAADIGAIFPTDEATYTTRPVIIVGEDEHALDCAQTIVARNHATMNHGFSDAGATAVVRSTTDRYPIVIIGREAELTVTRLTASLPESLADHYRFSAIDTCGSLAEAREKVSAAISLSGESAGSGSTELPDLAGEPTWIFVATEDIDRLIAAEQLERVCPPTIRVAAAIDRRPRISGPTSPYEAKSDREWRLRSPVDGSVRAIFISEYDELIADAGSAGPNRLGLIDDLAHRRFRSYVRPSDSWDSASDTVRRENRKFVRALLRRSYELGGLISLRRPEEDPGEWNTDLAAAFDQNLRAWATTWWAHEAAQLLRTNPALSASLAKDARGAQPDGLGADHVSPPPYTQWFLATLTQLHPPHQDSRSR